MNKLLLILTKLIFLLLFFMSCDKENIGKDISKITYWTQNELDQYATELINLKHIDTSFILANDVDDISTLRNIEEINGKLSIMSDKLENLDDLAELRKVGIIKIYGAKLLTEIKLPNLSVIENYLLITANSNLTKIEMNNLILVEESGIAIVNNPELETVNIPQLENYAGINIRYNPKFCYLELNTPIPDKALSEIQIDFNIMRASDSLFKNSDEYFNLKIGIANIENSDLSWIENINPDKFVSMKLFGNFSVSNFCGLKTMLNQTIQPVNFQIFDKNRNTPLFNGQDIIDECN